MATKKIKRFQEGGMSDKDRGLEASKDEKVGFFERLRAGNIDDPSSEAYRRFGAGRGRAESSKTAPPVASEPAAPAMPERSQDDSGAFNEAGSGVVNDTKPDMPRQRLNAAASKPAAPKPAPAKPPAMQEQSYRRTGGASADDRAQTYTRRGGATAEDRESFPRVAPASNPNYSNEGRSQAGKGKSLMDQIPRNTDMPAVSGERTSGSDLSRNVANISALGPGRLAGIGAIGMEMRGAEAARKAATAKKAADRTRELKAGQTKTKFTSESKRPSKKTKKFDDSESNIEFKRGGKAYASGGSVSPASKRADGIATRGKTRCKIC